MQSQVSQRLRRPEFGIGGDILDWFIGVEPQAVKKWLAAHGQEPITALAVGRVPLSKPVDLAMDVISGGKFSKIKKEASIDDFFHVFLIINNAYRLEKNQVVKVFGYSPAPKQETVTVPVTKRTIADFVEKAAAGREKAFWREYNPLSANCGQWVQATLSKNGWLTAEVKSFTNQNVEALIRGLPTFSQHAGIAVTDTAAALDRLLQFVSGGKLSFKRGGVVRWHQSFC